MHINPERNGGKALASASPGGGFARQDERVHILANINTHHTGISQSKGFAASAVNYITGPAANQSAGRSYAFDYGDNKASFPAETGLFQLLSGQSRLFCLHNEADILAYYTEAS